MLTATRPFCPATASSNPSKMQLFFPTHVLWRSEDQRTVDDRTPPHSTTGLHPRRENVESVNNPRLQKYPVNSCLYTPANAFARIM